jgi:hypothetical protein
MPKASISLEALAFLNNVHHFLTICTTVFDDCYNSFSRLCTTLWDDVYMCVLTICIMCCLTMFSLLFDDC